nr:DUF3373 family protein [Desulfobulbaceae bacterium]
NRQRQSTYPSLIFDGEADGIVGTLGLENWTGLKKSGLRVAYGKVYFSDSNDTDNLISDHSDTKDSTIVASFFETEIPAVDNSLMVLSYAHIFDMPAFLSESAESGMDGLILGDVDMFGLHVQAADIGNSGLDLYVSGSINVTDPNDEPENIGAGMGFMTGDRAQNNLFVDDEMDAERTGWAVVAGLRYELPIQALNNPKLGFEYNHGSRYHFTMTSGANELYNKFATRGDAYEVYYIQPASDNMFFRLGYTYVDYEYSWSGQPAGKPQEIDTEMYNVYMLMDVQF